MGGKRQANVLSALIQNFDTVEEAIEASAGSAGSALEENERYLDSIAGKMDQFNNAVQALWQNLLGSDIIKWVVDWGTKIIKSLNTVEGKFLAIVKVIAILMAYKKVNPLDWVKDISEWMNTIKDGGGIMQWLKSLLGLAPAMKVVTAETIANTIATEVNDAAKTKAILTSAGLTGATGALSVAQKKQAADAILAAVNAGTLSVAQGQAALATLGFATAINTADGSLKVLDVTTKFFMASNPIGWILAIVSVVVTLIAVLTRLINTTEKVAESAKEVMSAYQNATQTLKNHHKTIQDIRKDYEELSDGVDALGNNVSLTAEEYERYNDVVNQIADMFPNMVTGYTDEGNAIIALKGNVEALTKAYEDEARAARDAILIGQTDVFKNFKNNTTKKELGSRQNQFEKLSFFEDLINGEEFDNRDEDGNSIGTAFVDQWLEEAGIDSTKAVDSIEKFNEEIQKHLPQIQAYYRTLKATIDAEASSVRTILNAYLEQDLDYLKLSSEAKNTIKSIVNEFDAEFYSQFESASEMEAWVTTNLVQPLQDVDTSAEFDAAFDLQTKFNKGEVSIKEYEDMVAGIISLINGLGLENADSIIKSIKLVFDVDDSGAVDGAMQGVAHKLLDPSDYDKIKTLTKSELDIIDKNASEWAENATWSDATKTWEIGEPILMSWDELVKKIEEAKEATGDIKSSDSIESLVGIKDKLSGLGEAFEQFKEDGKVSIDTLSDLNEKFSNIDGFEDFINVLGNSASTTEQVEQAISDMASAYLATTDILSDVTDENYAFVVSQLKALGVTNPEEYLQSLQSVHAAMAEQYGVDLSNYGTVEQMKQAISGDLYSILLGMEDMTIQELASKYGDDLSNYASLEEAKTEAARREALKRQQILKNENMAAGAENAEGWKNSQTVAKDEINTGWWIFGKNKYEGKNYSDMESLAAQGDAKAKEWVDSVNATYQSMVDETNSNAETAYNDAIDGINSATDQFSSIDDYVNQYKLKLKVNANALGGDKDPDKQASDEANEAFKKEMDYWENRIAANQAKRDQIQNEIDLLETKGVRAGEEYYKELIALEEERKALLIAQRNEALAYLSTQEEGSEEWF